LKANSGDDVTTVVDATYVVSGANGVVSADVRPGACIAAVRVAFPWTPGADSEATADGRLGDDVAVVCHASPLAPGAVFIVADSDALDSDTHRVMVISLLLWLILTTVIVALFRQSVRVESLWLLISTGLPHTL